MLHMNTNTLADSLGTPKTITNNGATYDTNTYLFGSGSYYFGAGSYVSIAQHADFAYGNGSLADYCIDFRYYPKSLSATGVKLYSQIKDANNQLDFTLKNDGNLYITWIDNGTTYLSGTIPLAPTLNQWNHVSISKNWGYVRVFLNGLLQGQQLISVAANVGTYTGIPVIFSAADATGGATGYIQEYRTSKGVPRHVTNFTPETAVYTIPDTARTDTPDMNNPTIVDTYARFNIDKTSYNSKGLTKILFTFDDAWQVTYDNALPILNNYGFKGTTWAISDFVQGSDPNYMRASSLLSLYNTYNWDIGNHSKDHSDVIGQLPTASQILEYQTCYNFLISLGFTRSAAHVCYPSGNYSDSLISALKSIGMLTGRTTNGYLQTNIFPTASANDELFKLRCFALGSSTTPQNVYDKIDEAIDVGSTLMFMIHRIVPTPAQSIEFSTTNLDLVCQYIRAKRLDVVTISEWYNMLTNPRKVVSRI